MLTKSPMAYDDTMFFGGVIGCCFAVGTIPLVLLFMGRGALVASSPWCLACFPRFWAQASARFAG